MFINPIKEKMVNQVIVFNSMARYLLNKLSRLWIGFLPYLTSSILFYYIIAKVSEGSFRNINNITYASFIAPALIAGACLESALQASNFDLFVMKFDRSIESLLASPAKNSTIVLGYMVGALSRSLISFTILVTAYSLINKNPISNPILLLVTILLISAIMSLVGLLNAIAAKEWQHLEILNSVITPLNFLSGSLFDVDSFPLIIRIISRINPVFYFNELMRYYWIGQSKVNPFMILGGFVLVISVLFWLTQRRIESLRK